MRGENFEALKTSLTKARQALQDNKSEEAGGQLDLALGAIKDVVYEDQ